MAETRVRRTQGHSCLYETSLKPLNFPINQKYDLEYCNIIFLVSGTSQQNQ